MPNTTGAPLGRTTSILGWSQTLWIPGYIQIKKNVNVKAVWKFCKGKKWKWKKKTRNYVLYSKFNIHKTFFTRLVISRR